MAVLAAGKMRGSEFVRRNSAIALSYILVGVLFVAGTLHSPEFASSAHIRSMLIYASFIGIVGLGQTLCILTGGIDLSIPQTLTASAVVSSILANSDASRLPQITALVVGLAIVVGVINGVGIAYIGIPPIIMTLGMNGMLQGLMLVYTSGGFSSMPPHALISFVQGDTLGVSNDVLIWAVVTVFGILLLSVSSFGRKLYAVGTNRTAAYLAGIHVKRVLVTPYVISAVGAALTGLLVMGFNSQAFLGMGDPYLFSSAAAVAVGGASILGGEGHYVGTVAGSMILTLIAAILPVFGLGPAALDVAYGLIILATVFLATLRVLRR